MAENEQNEQLEDTPASKSPGFMTLVKALAFVSVIVLLEVAAASMLIPSAAETAEIAEKLASADKTADVEEDSTTSDESESLALNDIVEVKLGTFHVLTYNPETGSRLNVDFELYGTVLADEEPDFYPLFEASERRIREQILIAIRGADATDLTDAGLGLIKRKILEKTNRALGRPLLHEALFSKFSFEER